MILDSNLTSHVYNTHKYTHVPIHILKQVETDEWIPTKQIPQIIIVKLLLLAPTTLKMNLKYLPHMYMYNKNMWKQ